MPYVDGQTKSAAGSARSSASEPEVTPTLAANVAERLSPQLRVPGPHGPVHAALSATTRRKSPPAASGETARLHVESPPADSPNSATLSTSPPNAAASSRANSIAEI